MLYDTFRISVMITSAFGILHMLATSNYTYMYYPIMGLLWGIYSFFDENDKEYVTRNGRTNNDTTKKNSWWWGDGNTFDYDSTITSYRGSYRSSSRRSCLSKDYKHIATKCKRNFKITIGKNEND